MDKKKKKKSTKKELENEETTIYKPVRPKKIKKDKKDKKEKGKRKKHPKLRRFIKILLIMFLLLCIIGGGILAAILYRCIWGDWAITESDLKIPFENSVFYDKNNEICATVAGDENRQIVNKDEMSPYLFDAFISIEDERFREHSGVDWKRTIGATLSFALHSGESSYGGSTITQQTIKNLKDEREDSGFAGALRKIKEIVRAYQAENILSKDQILELYLNLIPLGSDKYGVQTASKYYFNKDAKDLSLIEAAYLAGITQAPSTYNPFSEKDPYTPLGENKRTKDVNKRVKTVLMKMNELGKINDEEYNNALNDIDTNGIKFERGSSSQNTQLPYYLEATVDQILNYMTEKEGWSRKEAEIHLYGDGYSIYTAFDPSIQAEVDAQFVNNAKNWYVIVKAKRKNEETGEEITIDEQRQGAMVVIDNETGYVVAGSGGLGEKVDSFGTNRMTIKGHNPGSCIKPIAVVGPSLEEGLITLGSVVDDTDASYGSYHPSNWYGGFKGLMNMRSIIECSTNVPEVKLLKNLTVEKSLEYLSRMGVDTSREVDDGLSLALGGMAEGLTPVEMAAAYAMIENGGLYREPLFYTKIVDAKGETYYEPEQKTERVLSEQNAWLLTELLKHPIYGGAGTGQQTGTAAAISGQEVRGKTGTTNNNSAAWFCRIYKILYSISMAWI